MREGLRTKPQPWDTGSTKSSLSRTAKRRAVRNALVIGKPGFHRTSLKGRPFGIEDSKSEVALHPNFIRLSQEKYTKHKVTRDRVFQ